MVGDSFYLSLKEFYGNIKISWKELQTDKDFCDVTLACDDKQIKAHKIIISSCSPVLKNILKLNQNNHPLIYFRKIKYKDLQNVINFMYQGEVDVAQEDLLCFLEVAEDLKITGLSKVNTEGSFLKEKKQSHLADVQQIDKSKKENKFDNIIKNIENKCPIDEDNEIQATPAPLNSISDIQSVVCDNILKEDKNKAKSERVEKNEYTVDGINDLQQIDTSKKENKFDNVLKNIGNEYLIDEDNEIQATLTPINFINDNQSLVCDKNGSESGCLQKNEYPVAERINDRQALTNSIVKNKGVICDRCEKQFTRKETLIVHMESVHRGVRYPCKQCNYKATQKNNLKSHIHSIHEGAVYLCDQCSYKARKKFNLKIHIDSMHTGVRYSCDQCSHKTTQKRRLNKHKKLVHHKAI